MTNYIKLKQLREETGVSFSLCKKALEEAKDDISKAKKLLTKWGGQKVKDKEGKITSQGVIASYLHHNKKIASLVELKCETDFVAANEEFLKLASELAMQVASVKATTSEELLKQEYIRDSSKTIETLIKEAVLKFGENVKIGRIIRLELGLEN